MNTVPKFDDSSINSNQPSTVSLHADGSHTVTFGGAAEQKFFDYMQQLANEIRVAIEENRPLQDIAPSQ